MKAKSLHITISACLLLLAILAFPKAALAQKLEVESFIQKTVMGVQSGYGLGFRAKKGYGVGAFYQSTNHLSFEKGTANYPAYGLDLSVPFKTADGLSILGHLKPGVVNQKFLVLIPEIETRITLAPFAKIAIGAGLRSRQAAISAKIIITTL